ncbi:putative D-alanine/glycine transport protein, sodium-dependent [Neochlamydia sp. TUME1]|uniref:amino acid carrier protein n=1 Tax=Neochlamydia sp. TUME1 TaxID=1478174 RepID=UPI00058257DD|nr:amino acid carrier protein [Neochlamydia sp. TUME1]KIC74959.1 putative D-alanine/glycine transport protein, sodium-dependent [Neochlamydia sp. TUME1]
MLDNFFIHLEQVENILWGYVAVPTILLLGVFLSFQARWVQIVQFPRVVKTFFGFLFVPDKDKSGVHPLQAFFACVGGCVGIGNIVGITTAVQIGGPGALLWIWLTAIAGMMIKYSEVYLGIRYRVPNAHGGYNGGPMYFLQRVFKGSFVPTIVGGLLCIYGVEVYQFNVIVKSVTANVNLSPYLVLAILLALVIFAGQGGVRRVGNISGISIPLFVFVYLGMGCWVLIQNIDRIPEVLKAVFNTAFTGHAAVGGFIGSSAMGTISQGVRRGCYTGDLGVGYASVIHSESFVKIPEKQASLVIFDIFVDTFMICTTSILIILVTDLWHQPINSSLLIQTALAQYFPYMEWFMPLFLFLLGYSTINAYFCVGLKCAEYLHPRKGRKLYYIYAVITLGAFALVDTAQAQTVMTIAGGLLLVLNCYGIFKLRHEISYNFNFLQNEKTEGRSIAVSADLG